MNTVIENDDVMSSPMTGRESASVIATAPLWKKNTTGPNGGIDTLVKNVLTSDDVVCIQDPEQSQHRSRKKGAISRDWHQPSTRWQGEGRKRCGVRQSDVCIQDQDQSRRRTRIRGATKWHHPSTRFNKMLQTGQQRLESAVDGATLPWVEMTDRYSKELYYPPAASEGRGTEA